MNITALTRNRLLLPGLVALMAGLAVACPGPTPTPTTTTTSTTTASTTTTTIDPNCGAYTPTNLALSSSTASAGGGINVSGTGEAGKLVVITLRSVSTGTVVNPGTTATVQPDETWSTPLTLPGSLAAGDWDVLATAQGCTAEASAQLTIVP
ncbi:MAG: hypothetical protein F2942_01905 [Actinobacteria bacterium]|jgi:hypothetical protein|uniref:Unannotated protein n=1 Tax=freshwater metagenome TaxID=449393 RepID=A0A6J7U8Z5_9ZZZZ|nr:hypothetical protein [Actinomycetota bacterium]